MKLKIALQLLTMTPEEKMNFLVLLINALTSHASTFPAPNPTLAALVTAKNNLNTRITTIGAMSDNLKSEQSALALYTTEIDQLIIQLADYILNIANGDPSIVQLSGFDLAPEPSRAPVGPLSPPQNLVGIPTDIEGQVKLKWKRVRGANSYIVECAEDPNGPWNQIGVTPRVSHLAGGLTGGKKYWFRVRAVGAAGYSGWSDPAMKMAA